MIPGLRFRFERMPEHFHIEAPYVPLFREHGLVSFAVLMNGSVGEMVSCLHDRRKLYRLTLPSADGQTRFYLKRMRDEPAVWLLRSLLYGRRPHSGPLREMQMLTALREAGFTVMKPVAWGEERRWGVPIAGFLVVAEVQGAEVAGLFDTYSGAERHALLGQVGGLVGRLHAAGFFHPVRLKDLICEEPLRQLVLIDRETSKPWPARFSRQRAVSSLARAARRTLRDGHRLGPASVRHFLDGYAAEVAGRWRVSTRNLRQMVLDRMRRDLG